MKRILLLFWLLSSYSISLAQGGSGPQGVRPVNSLPATCVATGSASSDAPVKYLGKIYICTATNTWTESGTGATVVSATETVEGKAVLGAQAPVAFASLGTCAAGNRGQSKQLTDLNKGTRTCTLTTGSTYAWVDDDGGIFKAKRFGTVSGGAAATNVTAINAALTAINANGGGVLDISDGSYSVNATMPLYNNVTIRGNGTITQTTNNTAIFSVTGLSNVKILGLSFVGKGTDFVDSSSDPARAITGTGVTNLQVSNCSFLNFTNSAIFVTSTGLIVSDNIITGPGSPTLTAHTSFNCFGLVVLGSHLLVSGNKISQTAQGIFVGQDANFTRLIGNTIHDIIGQHGVYADAGQRELVIAANNVYLTADIGIKVQNYDAAVRSAENISITGNTIWNTGADGIAVLSTTTSAILTLNNVTITGNTIRTVAQYGMVLRHIRGGVVQGNTIDGVATDGIDFQDNKRMVVANNQIRNTQQIGIRLYGTATDDVQLISNILTEIGLAGTASNNHGLYILQASNVSVVNNTIRCSTAGLYPLFISSGDQTTMIVRDNTFSGGTGDSARFKNPVEALKFYGGNILSSATTDLPITAQRGRAQRDFYGTVAPTSGAFLLGDITWNYTPSANSVIGWVNTTAGSPGTWSAFYSSNQATATTSTPTFGTTTLSSSSSNLLDVVSSAATLNTVAKFRSTDSAGFTSILIDRPSAARYALTGYGTAGTEDWFTGVAYGGGGSNSAYTIGTTITASDAKFSISKTTGVLTLGASLALTNVSVTATSGGTTTLDLSLGNHRSIQMPAGNTTLALSNVCECDIDLSVLQDSVGGRTITFPSTMREGTITLAKQPSPTALYRTDYSFRCDTTNCYLKAINYDGVSGQYMDLVNDQSVAGTKTFTTALRIASSSANALVVGLNGVTNPALQVDASTVSSATGVSVTSAAAGAGVGFAAISSGSNEQLNIAGKGTGSVKISPSLIFNQLAFSNTAPTVTSAGTSPSIPFANGTAAFTVNVGSGGTATTVVLAMPAATNGWNCQATNRTAAAANRADFILRQTATTTTSVTIQSQSGTLGTALAFAANDIIACICTAY